MNIDLILFDDKLNLYNFLFKRHLKKSVTELSLIFFKTEKPLLHTLMEVLCWKNKEKHCYYLWLDGQFVSIPPQSTGYIIPPNGCLLVDNNEIRIDVLESCTDSIPPLHSWLAQRNSLGS